VNTGKLQVYTGNGKGKTTAAFGLAIRAAGHDKKVLIIQFLKGSINYGELISARKLGIKVMQFGRPDFVNPKKPAQIDIDWAVKGLEELREAIISGDWDVVVADELNVTIKFGLLGLKDVLQVLAVRNPKTELIVTGRYAPPEIIESADLVTEMNLVKHYFDTEGLDGREGIEF
jgi:cob(I)alamin adenosyltransferase